MKHKTMITPLIQLEITIKLLNSHMYPTGANILQNKFEKISFSKDI